MQPETLFLVHRRLISCYSDINNTRFSLEHTFSSVYDLRNRQISQVASSLS